MDNKRLTFAEIVTAAAKSVPELWDQDGKLNLAALARYYKKKGYPITQATLHRLFAGKHKTPSPRAIDATHFALRVPRGLLRGEGMNSDLERALTDYNLSTLFLAKKIEALPQRVKDNILNYVETELEREEQLRRAIDSGAVTSIDRPKPHGRI